MTSLEKYLEELEADLTASPMRIAAQSDMPFAIVPYPPNDEYKLRKIIRLMQFSFAEKYNRNIHIISLSRIVWDCVRESEGVDYLYETEKMRGFDIAQQHIGTVLGSNDYRSIEGRLVDSVQALDPKKDIVFLVRAGGFAPFIYRCSILLERLHRRTSVPTILFYPGTADAGSSLKFYNLPEYTNLGTPNYRVKVYGDAR